MPEIKAFYNEFTGMGGCDGNNPATGKCYNPIAYRVKVGRAVIYLCKPCLPGE